MTESDGGAPQTGMRVPDPQELGVLNEAYRSMQQIYGLGGEFVLEARTLPEYLFRKYQFGYTVPEGEDYAYLGHISPKLMVETTQHIRGAIGVLKDEYGVDLLADRRALADPEKSEACSQGLNAVIGKNPTYKAVNYELMSYVFAKDLVNLFRGTRRTFRSGIENTQARLNDPNNNDTLRLAAATAQLSYYKTVEQNVSNARYEAHRMLRYLCGDEVSIVLDYADEVFSRDHASAPESQPNEAAQEMLASKKQELDFTILPPGTTLREAAEAIADNSSEYTRAHIDLQRVAVLDTIWEMMGRDRCYPVQGKPTGKKMTDEDGALISEDYIGIVIQHHNSDGTVTAEDCVAISPIARKHAGYIVRQDASEGLSWREILSLPKNDAITFFGARRLRFDPVTGMDKYEAYIEKVRALLNCPKEEFGRDYVLQRKANNEYKMIHRGKPMGSLALYGSSLE